VINFPIDDLVRRVGSTPSTNAAQAAASPWKTKHPVSPPQKVTLTIGDRISLLAKANFLLLPILCIPWSLLCKNCS
jgi:hypothetical protein